MLFNSLLVFKSSKILIITNYSLNILELQIRSVDKRQPNTNLAKGMKNYSPGNNSVIFFINFGANKDVYIDVMMI